MAVCFQTALSVHRPHLHVASGLCRQPPRHMPRRVARSPPRPAPKLCAPGGDSSASKPADQNPEKEEQQKQQQQQQPAAPSSTPLGWLSRLMARRSAVRAGTLRDYGVAALLSYGLFDALTYSISFLLSLRAYIAAGKVLTWGTLPQVLALMWGINNLSRPFRIAGALAIAPAVDRRVVKPVAAFVARLRKA